jgi:hypothetical protein
VSPEARFWNTSQSISFSAGSKVYLVVSGFRMLNIIGRWSESTMSVTMTSDSWTFWGTIMLRTSPLPAGV